MEDKDLIAQLSHLKEIKPRQEWVVSTQKRLFGGKAFDSILEQAGHGVNLQKGGFWVTLEGIVSFMARSLQKPAFVIPMLAFIVAGGAVGRAAYESLPGDKLFPVKAAAEQVYLRFAGEEERPAREFALAQQRLADLRVIAEQNKVKNLPLAIQEFEANAAKISEGFVQIVEKQPGRALQASRQMVQLQKEKSAVEEILGTKIGEEQEEELRDATKRLVEYELGYLETRSLTESQEELFGNAKTAAEEGNYESALEYIWQLSQGVQEEG